MGIGSRAERCQSQHKVAANTVKTQWTHEALLELLRRQVSQATLVRKELLVPLRSSHVDLTTIRRAIKELCIYMSSESAMRCNRWSASTYKEAKAHLLWGHLFLPQVLQRDRCVVGKILVVLLICTFYDEARAVVDPVPNPYVFLLSDFVRLLFQFLRFSTQSGQNGAVVTVAGHTKTPGLKSCDSGSFLGSTCR